VPDGKTALPSIDLNPAVEFELDAAAVEDRALDVELDPAVVVEDRVVAGIWK
jgi:hypothetical protein